MSRFSHSRSRSVAISSRARASHRVCSRESLGGVENQLVSGIEPSVIASDSWLSLAHSITPSAGERPISKGTSECYRAERISSRVFLPETTPETALAILRTWFQRNA